MTGSNHDRQKVSTGQGQMVADAESEADGMMELATDKRFRRSAHFLLKCARPTADATVQPMEQMGTPDQILDFDVVVVIHQKVVFSTAGQLELVRSKRRTPVLQVASSQPMTYHTKPRICCGPLLAWFGCVPQTTRISHVHFPTGK